MRNIFSYFFSSFEVIFHFLYLAADGDWPPAVNFALVNNSQFKRDSHLIFSEFNKFNVKISVIPNGLEKYMTFFLNKNLVFIDSMQYLNCSLDKLVKNLLDEDFKYLVEEFGSESLELLKQKGA